MTISNSKQIFKQKIRILLGLLPIVIGGLIYLTYRTDTLLMFNWFNKIGLSSFIDFLRSNEKLQNLIIPSWVKYSLPDALWMFSLNYVLLTLWDFKINGQSIFWLFLALIIGIISEVGQLFGVIPGTFDLVDLFLLLTVSIIPFLFVKNIKTLKFKFT